MLGEMAAGKEWKIIDKENKNGKLKQRDHQFTH